MSFDLDKDKSQMFFLYSLAAAQRVQKKEDAHKKLSDQLSKIKDLDLDDSVRKHVQMLEKRIGDLVRTEKTLTRVQKVEKDAQVSITDRLDFLDSRLAGYQRARRQHAMMKVAKRRSSKPVDKLAPLRKSLTLLEAHYKKVSKDKSVSKLRMRNLSRRITSLKSKLKK